MSWVRRLFGAMQEEEMAGLRLADPRWRVRSQKVDTSRFLAALPQLVPTGGWLFVEGGSHPPRLRAFLEEQKRAVSPRPALGTVWPRRAHFTLPLTAEVVDRLVRVTASLPYPEVCDHLHVFEGAGLVLSGYDAFAQDFLVAASVPEEQLKLFCSAAGCTMMPGAEE